MDLTRLKSGASGTPPSAAEAVSAGYPTAGSAIDDIPASKPGPYWFYQIQQEIAAVLADASIVADKATLTQLRDAIRAIATSKAGASVQTTTSTGTQNDFAATAARRLVLRANNGSTLTLSGFAAGQDGDVLELIAVGAGEVDITNQDSGSSAVNRVITPTGATVKLTAAKGRARFVYDNTTQRWRMTAADPASTQFVIEGVSFPASQVASSDANTLDDYEEGTWTPVIGGSTGTSGQSYSARTGTYIKIGKIIVAHFDATLSAAGSLTGTVQIQGFPFAAADLDAVCTVFFAAMSSGFINIQVKLASGATVADMESCNTASTSLGSPAVSNLSNTTRLVGTMIYRATS